MRDCESTRASTIMGFPPWGEKLTLYERMLCIGLYLRPLTLSLFHKRPVRCFCLGFEEAEVRVAK